MTPAKEALMNRVIAAWNESGSAETQEEVAARVGINHAYFMNIISDVKKCGRGAEITKPTSSNRGHVKHPKAKKTVLKTITHVTSPGLSGMLGDVMDQMILEKTSDLELLSRYAEVKQDLRRQGF